MQNRKKNTRWQIRSRQSYCTVPFIKDENGNFIRTPRRHDFSLEPPGDTLLDVLKRHGKDTIAVGKIYDIFAHRGMSEHYFTTGNTQGIAKTLEISKRDFDGTFAIQILLTAICFTTTEEILTATQEP